MVKVSDAGQSRAPGPHGVTSMPVKVDVAPWQQLVQR